MFDAYFSLLIPTVILCRLGGEVVAADKLALSLPLRPGVWTISVYVRGTRSMKYIEGSKTHFTGLYVLCFFI